jgi:hypothetical protein
MPNAGLGAGSDGWLGAIPSPGQASVERVSSVVRTGTERRIGVTHARTHARAHARAQAAFKEREGARDSKKLDQRRGETGNITFTDERSLRGGLATQANQYHLRVMSTPTGIPELTKNSLRFL